MLFYTPKNDEGRTILCTTQADSDKIQKGASKIDVPVDKAGLKAVMQDSIDTIFERDCQIIILKGMANGMPADAEPDTSDIPEATEEFFEQAKLIEPTKRDTLVSSSYEATDIENYILTRASPSQVENIFSCLGARFAEMRPSKD